MRFSRTLLSNSLVLLILFLLPFQTRWIFNEMTIAGQPWEYGRLSLYAVEAMIMAASVLRGTIRLDAKIEPFIKPTILLLGALFLGASFSQNITLAFSAILHASAAVALFAILLDQRTNAKAAASAFVLGLIVPAALAWYQVVTGTSPSSTILGLASHDAATLGASVVETALSRVLRGYGTLPHPNIFGGYLAIGTIVAAWLAANGRRAGYVLPVLAATLVVTFSRGAWLAAIVGLALAAALAHKFPSPSKGEGRGEVRAVSGRRQSGTAVAFVSLLAVILTVATFRAPIFTRLDATSRLEEKSVSERTSEYQIYPDVVRQNAFTGVGAGNYTFALATLYPGKDVWFYQPLHNAILLFLAETGILGLLVVARFAQVLVGFLRNKRSSFNRVAVLPVLAAVLILALIDHYLWSLWPGMSLAAVALAIAIKSSIDNAADER